MAGLLDLLAWTRLPLPSELASVDVTSGIERVAGASGTVAAVAIDAQARED